MSGVAERRHERGRHERRVIAEQLHGGAAVLRVRGLRADEVEQRRLRRRAEGREDRARVGAAVGIAPGEIDEAGRRGARCRTRPASAAMTSATSGRDSR